MNKRKLLLQNEVQQKARIFKSSEMYSCYRECGAGRQCHFDGSFDATGGKTKRRNLAFKAEIPQLRPWGFARNDKKGVWDTHFRYQKCGRSSRKDGFPCFYLRNWVVFYLMIGGLTATVFLSFLGIAIKPSFAQELTISSSDFKNMVEEYSEEGDTLGFDNWISNEPNFWSVLNSLRKQNNKRSVFIGVGPDQNFAYIEALKPEIALIVDIRHQNLIQHLVYKALFEISDTPLEYIASLLSKEISYPPSKGMNIGEIVNCLKDIPASEKTYLYNLNRIIEILEADYDLALCENDYKEVAYMLANFCKYGFSLNLFGSPLVASIWITYDKYLTLKDLSGDYVYPFAKIEKYQFLKKMQFENRIIPLVGDFTGAKAFGCISEFMKENNLRLSAFYVSNVEEKILLGGDWNKYSSFVENIRSLPRDDESVIIRTTNMSTPFSINQNHLQKVSDFLRNYDNGVYKSYTDIIDIDRDYYK